MSLDNFVRKWIPSWIREEGPESDVVLSSRVRLARNFVDLPFPHLASDTALREVIKRLKNAVEVIKNHPPYQDLQLNPLNEMSGLDRLILVEKHLVSPQFIENFRDRAVILNGSETISIMINEEDHLRIQCFSPGLELQKAWEEVNRLDDLLEEKLHFAFLEDKGYLTACPTNAGTGMRASVMVHLPALAMTKQIGKVVNNVAKFGLTVRGLYGEGTEAFGNIFQISNQITLGLKEEEIIDNLYRVTKHVIEQERTMREGIMTHGKEGLLNKVGRAYGTLKYAHIISSQEAMTHLSDLRLGAALNLYPQVSKQAIDELIILIAPAFLQKIMGQELGPEERDLKRAELIREKLS
ncbi:MAG TPA: protein arginine kinase [Clostridia bacterium]|jgi:protein arginine kinase|nr:protein arginine kinase [Clostridia bacterium]